MKKQRVREPQRQWIVLRDASRHYRPVVAVAAFLPHRLSLSPPPSLIVLPRFFFCFFSFVPRIKGSLGIFGVHFFVLLRCVAACGRFRVCLVSAVIHCRRLPLLLLLLLLALWPKAFFVGFLPSGEGDGFLS